MLYYGEFLTQRGETCRVEFTTGGSRTPSREIGGADRSILFTSSPVETTFEGNDTFDHLLRTSATVRLLTRGFLSDLYSSSPWDTEVRITLDGKSIFLGFVEPRTYSQPFNDVYDELEINCIDLLSALQYRRFKNCGSPGVDYGALRESAGMETLKSILTGCLSHTFTGPRTLRAVWDKSVQLTAAGGDPFSGISIHTLLFLGDDEDGVWTAQKVTEEIMKYLNLHIRQEGDTLFIFNIDNMQEGVATEWHSLSNGVSADWNREEVEFSTVMASGTDTRLSVGEVYNRIRLTADVKAVESVVESPLDDDSILSPFSGRQLYQTVYRSYADDHADCGKVTFRILGPVNLMWNNVTRRHRTFFRSEKWSEGFIPLMAHVSSIRIKDFEVAVVSDNAHADSGDGEIVYVSDTDERYVNERDDLTFKITTALTAEERLELGVGESVKLSAPSLTASGDLLLEVYSSATGETAKPERHYVDARWREWHEPRITLEQGVRSIAGISSMTNIFRHPALPGKRFWVVGMSRDVMAGKITLNLKECNDD